jgi:hypothetical protein
MKLNNLKKTYVKCRGCGKRMLLSLFKYCPNCVKLANRLYQEHFSAEARKGFWSYLNKHGRRCCFSGVSLGIEDDTSPWFLEFDHWMPRDPRKIVITSAVLNIMKSDLTEKEFWYFIRQLANHYRYGSPVRKIKLTYWSRPYR